MQRKGKGRDSNRCAQGHIHDSRAEARYCNQLELLRRGKVVKAVQYQVTLPLAVKGFHICNHRVDFVAEFLDGHKEIFEVKGFANEVWPIKKKLTEALYPKMKYNVVDARRV
jgi:hypothetical protein